MPSATPFNFNQPFRTELFAGYLIPYANWLFGESEKQMTAEISGSPWEAALSQMFADAVLKETEKNHKELLPNLTYDYDDFKVKTKNLLFWLSKRALRPSDLSPEEQPHDAPKTNEICWDAVTWDTATITRCMLKALTSVELELEPSRKEELNNNVFCAVRWMCGQIEDWQNSGMYSFGF